MTTYAKTEERPLSVVIGDRKGFYQAKIAAAFDKVYSSGNFRYIEQFEKAVLSLSAGIMQGNLEGRVLMQEPDAMPRIRKRSKAISDVDRRPRLTSHQYAKARDEGLTNELIRERFRMSSPYQICGFAKAYKARKAKPKK